MLGEAALDVVDCEAAGAGVTGDYDVEEVGRCEAGEGLVIGCAAPGGEEVRVKVWGRVCRIFR